jgi:RNA polymerase sigma-70 factor (ECF subfamily)
MTRAAARFVVGSLPLCAASCSTCGGGNTRPAPDHETATWEAEYQQRLFAWAVEQVRPQVRPATWQAFWRTAVEGQPAQEVAASLSLSIASVYLAKSRVMARLKAILEQAQEPGTADSQRPDNPEGGST